MAKKVKKKSTKIVKKVKVVKPKPKAIVKPKKTKKVAEKPEEKEKTVQELLKDFKFKPFYQESFTVNARIGKDETGAVPGWMFDSVIRFEKTKCRTLENLILDFYDTEDPFQKTFLEWAQADIGQGGMSIEDIKKLNIMKDDVQGCITNWDCVKPYEISDVFKLESDEHRRLLFNVIGAEKIWEFVEPHAKLLGKETIKRNNPMWELEGNDFLSLAEKGVKPITQKLENTYELFEIPLKVMFPEMREGNRRNENMYMVKMECVSNKQHMHMIYVPAEIGQTKDPIAAIAWTYRVDTENPEFIMRQGDVIICKHKDNGKSKKVTPYHLNKKQYLELVTIES